MELKKLICSCCGGELVIKDDTHYLCPYCKALYEKDNAEEIQEILSSALEQDKLERLSNARRVLYDATIKTKYPSKVKVLAATTNVLSINPDDVFAQVVSYSYEDEYELTNLLPALELDHATAEQVYHWLMRDIYPRIVGPLGDFIQRHFEGEEYAEKLTALEDEAEKEQEGYYLSTLPRDVFICYSSKDMPEVIHIMDVLEENGFSCFAAFRNLRHGKEAQEDYWEEITQAMEACKTLIFISSKNSRYIKCDAITKELPFLARNLDDKPRFEYMLDRGDHVADLVQDVLKEAFPTQERVHDESTLVRRVKYLLDELKAPKKKQSDIALEEFNKKQAELDAKLKALEEAERKRQERLEAEEKAKAEKEAARLAKEQEEAKRKQEEALLKAKKEQEEKLLREQKAKEEADRKEQERLAEQKARQEAEERRLKELEERLAKQLEEKYKGVPTPEQKYSESAPKKAEVKREISLSKDFIKKSEFVDLGDKYINFGYYPQKKVTDILLMKTLDKLSSDENDLVNHDGQLFGKANNQYFSFEPIKWKIFLDEDSKTTLISESIIDFKRFDSRGADYEYSDIREYLNNDFIRISFASSGPEIIKNNHNDKVGLATNDFVKFLNSDNPNVTNYCETKQKGTDQNLSICLEDSKYVTGRLATLDKTGYYGVRPVITIKYTAKYHYQRLELEEYKASTKEELETFILNEDSNKYLSDLWKKAEKSIDDGLKNIDLAKNKGEVKYVKDNVINEINKYKKSSEEQLNKISSHRDLVKKELDDLDKNIKQKYAWDVWKKFNNVLLESYKKIDSSNEESEMDRLKRDVIAFTSTLDEEQAKIDLINARNTASKKINELLVKIEKVKDVYSRTNYEKICAICKGALQSIATKINNPQEIDICVVNIFAHVNSVPTLKYEEEQKRIANEKAALKEKLEHDFITKNHVLTEYKGNDIIVNIPQGILKIESKVFAGNKNIKEVNIPNGVESIGDYAFSGCENLTKITIPNSVKNIYADAFSNCKNLEYITLPVGLTRILSNTFYGCESLTSIAIPNGVKVIERQAFCKCKKLEEIIIPDSVTDIYSEAFRECSSLEKITLPNNLRSIGDSAFRFCKSLKSIDIPNSVKDVAREIFDGCTSLQCINLSNNTEFIQDRAFQDCASLKAIVIPKSVKIISNNAFNGCNYLHIFYKNGCWDTVRPKYDNFRYGRSSYNYIKHFEKDGYIYNVYSDNKYVEIVNYINTNVEKIDIPETVVYEGKTYNVSSIGQCAFANFEKLKTVELPSTISRISNGAFKNCKSLESIKLPDKLGDREIYDSVFSQCSSLKTIFIPSNIRAIGYGAFSGCSSLTSILLPNTIKEIRSGAFADCTALTSIKLPESIGENLGDNVFKGCSNLKEVYIVGNSPKLKNRLNDRKSSNLEGTQVKKTLFGYEIKQS